MFRKLVLVLILLLITFFNFDISLADPTDIELQNQRDRAEKERIDTATQQTKDGVEARNAACDKSGDCLDRPNFMVPVSGMFNFGGSNKIGGSNAKERINNTFGFVIQKMMIALGIISLFIMTIGAGYIIIYHGQDDLLGKGKNIFIAGVTSLVIALSSYYIVSLVRYLIFTT